MGSSYLLAHGLGVPVKDARTTITIPAKESTVSGSEPATGCPRGMLAEPPENSSSLSTIQPLKQLSEQKVNHGTGRTEELSVSARVIPEIALHDLTGFEGRCDAILLTTNQKFRPPDEKAPLDDFRKTSLGLSTAPGNGGDYDLCSCRRRNGRLLCGSQCCQIRL